MFIIYKFYFFGEIYKDSNKSSSQLSNISDKNGTLLFIWFVIFKFNFFLIIKYIYLYD